MHQNASSSLLELAQGCVSDEVSSKHRSKNLPHFHSTVLLTQMLLTTDISWMEMSKLIPTLVMHYHLELVDEKAEWSETC